MKFLLFFILLVSSFSMAYNPFWWWFCNNSDQKSFGGKKCPDSGQISTDKPIITNPTTETRETGSPSKDPSRSTLPSSSSWFTDKPIITNPTTETRETGSPSKDPSRSTLPSSSSLSTDKPIIKNPTSETRRRKTKKKRETGSPIKYPSRSTPLSSSSITEPVSQTINRHSLPPIISETDGGYSAGQIVSVVCPVIVCCVVCGIVLKKCLCGKKYAKKNKGPREKLLDNSRNTQKTYTFDVEAQTLISDDGTSVVYKNPLFKDGAGRNTTGIDPEYIQPNVTIGSMFSGGVKNK